MDLDPTTSAHYGSPTAVFQNIDSLLDATGPWSIAHHENFRVDTTHTPWHLSQCNPATRINSLNPLLNTIWTIDGSQGAGRRFYAWPSGLQPLVAPLRVDVWIPEPAAWPPHLRPILQANANVHTRGTASANLGIARHVMRALEHWSNGITDFDSYYRALPFGSRIVVKHIASRIEEINIEVEENGNGVKLTSFTTLQSNVNLPNGRTLPVCKDVNDFEHLKAFSETVSLVRLRNPQPAAVQEEYIMKASVEFASRIYHELKVLLSLPEYPHIIKPPVFLVTCGHENYASDPVVGFVLEYHAEGSLRSALAIEHGWEPHHWHDRILWAKQIVSALMFLNKNTKTCYGEVKTENLVLSKNPSGRRDIVMIDFESHGAGDIWTAPEMGYLENLRSIVRGSEIPPSTTKGKYTALWQSLMHSVHQDGSSSTQFDDFLVNDIEKENYSILDLETVQVFRLGLVLYCIFEGVGWPKIRISSSWTHESTTQFPQFIRTPSPLRKLILRCTAGAREHNPDSPSLVRRGNMVYPKSMTGLNGERRGKGEDVIQVSRELWLSELEGMERFFEAKERYENDSATESDLEYLSYLRRPKLQEILDEL
ncbi:hypothetical protein K469DRAFT_631698, partial [Zopfia rhizophila CBS 207.26]